VHRNAGAPWISELAYSPLPAEIVAVGSSLVYDLPNRLNAAFARVHPNMEALQQVGIFDPLMMQTLNRQSEQLRAGAITICLGP
jgi:hypothetical protein